MKKKILIIVLILLVLSIIVALKIYIDKTTFVFYGEIKEIIGTSVYMDVQPNTEKGFKGICTVHTHNVKILDKYGKKITISELKMGDKISVVTKSNIINYMNPPSFNQVKQIKVLKDN